MKMVTSPNGEEITIPEGRVISFGLTAAQNDLIRRNLPTHEWELFETRMATDIIAISADAVVIDSSALSKEDREMIIEYFGETHAYLEQSVYWIGSSKLTNHLRGRIRNYDCVELVVDGLKYQLIQAHKRAQKSRDFSRKIADCIMILSLIRSHPGIRTKELTEQMELPTRTVQRYITTLQVAGEWIEYDTIKRGWMLQNGISVLFGDHLQD